MFTGIIKDLGKLQEKEDHIFTFKAAHSLCQKLDQGISIAVNGACLTILGKTVDSFAVKVMPETVKRTMLGTLLENDLVNLELPVTPKDLLSGHLVQGHVDGVGQVADIERDQNANILTISFPKTLSKYVVEKGSVAVNGISLTVIEAKKDFFTVGITPYTWDQTMLHTLKIGDLVNLEVDIIAKYVERYLR